MLWNTGIYTTSHPKSNNEVYRMLWNTGIYTTSHPKWV